MVLLRWRVKERIRALFRVVYKLDVRTDCLIGREEWCTLIKQKKWCIDKQLEPVDCPLFDFFPPSQFDTSDISWAV